MKLSFPKTSLYSGEKSIRISSATDTTRSIMLDMLIALLPAAVWATFNFGLRALMLILFSALVCTLSEFIYLWLSNKRCTPPDLSATVSGVLIAFCSPPDTPFFMIAIADIVAIIIIKMFFGGIGRNILNPALIARVILYFGTKFLYSHAPAFNSLLNNDVLSSATPLESLAEEIEPISSISQSFLGTENGLIGEVSVLMLLLGLFYLFFKRIVSWHIPVAFIASFALVLYINAPTDMLTYRYIIYELFSGSIALIAFFMATDSATSPLNKKGKIIFGIGCGAISAILRSYLALNEYASFAVIIMNLSVPLIDKITKPIRFGAISQKRKFKSEQSNDKG